MNLILSFEKDTLNAMRLELTKLHQELSKSVHTNASGAVSSHNSLHQVRFDEFCSVMLDRILEKEEKHDLSDEFYSSIEFTSTVRSIALYFDAVDVDYRGVISFTDFTNFCLRSGRIRFKPSMKRPMASYSQNHRNKTAYFPTFKLCFHPHDQTMYAFDHDSPIARIYRDGKYCGKINPVADLKRSLKLQTTGSSTYFNQKKLDREALLAKSTWRDLDATKTSVLCMEYIESTREIVISTSGGYLVFCEAQYSITEEEGLKIIAHQKVEFAQYGAMYSKPMDMLVTWTGEASDHLFEIWDPVSHKLRFKVKKHDYKILSVCEMVLDSEHPLTSHYIASSSMDKRVLLWPTAPITSKTQARKGNMIRAADTVGYELKGYTHAILSLVYAPQHEMLIGCGFDYEIYGWDPFTRDICMKFIGHFKSMFRVQVVMIPHERLVSLDESGVLKVWNIDKDLGLFGEVEQTLRVSIPSNMRVRDFISAFNDGATVAIQADRTYFLEVEAEALDDLRPISGGLGLCENSGRMWCITRNAITSINLLNGSISKRLAFLDQDRISSKELLRIQNDAHIAGGGGGGGGGGDVGIHGQSQQHGAADGASAASASNGIGLDHKHRVYHHDVSYIDAKDTITAVAGDKSGRKLFLGTNDGRVLLYDTFTFGLLLQLTDEKDDGMFLHQGSVVGLDYIDRDELVVAVYSNGAVKVLVGCHRTSSHGNASIPTGLVVDGIHGDKAEQQPVSLEEKLLSQVHSRHHHKHHHHHHHRAIARPYPSSGGGKPPSTHFLIREVDLGVVSDNSIGGSCFSVDHNLIATYTKKGHIFVYNYLDMQLLSTLKIPPFEGQEAMCSKVIFTPMVPVILAIDNCGRVTAWSARPMKFAWLHTWSLYHQTHFAQDLSAKKKKKSPEDENVPTTGAFQKTRLPPSATTSAAAVGTAAPSKGSLKATSTNPSGTSAASGSTKRARFDAASTTVSNSTPAPVSNSSPAVAPPPPARTGWAGRSTAYGKLVPIRNQFEYNLPTSGMQLTAIKCIYWEEEVPKDEVKTSESTKLSNINSTAGSATTSTNATSLVKNKFPLAKVTAIATKVHKAKEILKRRATVRNQQQRVRSSSFDSIESSVDSERNQEGGSSSIAEDDASSSESSSEEDDDEVSVASSTGSTDDTLRRKWHIIVGDEGGNMMVVDITRLIVKTNAIRNLPRPNAHFAVYTRQKPIRMQSLASYDSELHDPRAVAATSTAAKNSSGLHHADPVRLSVESMELIENPVGGQIVMADIDPFGSSRDSSSTPLGVSAATGSSKKSSPKSPSSNKSSRRRGGGMLGLMLRYAEGVRKWVGSAGQPVREIVVVRADSSFRADATGFMKECSFGHPGTQWHYHHGHRRVLEPKPHMIFVASDVGNVLKYSWEGQYMGQLKDELRDSSKTCEEAEDQAYADLALEAAIKAAQELQEKEQQRLQQLELERQEQERRQHHHHQQKNPGAIGTTSVSITQVADISQGSTSTGRFAMQGSGISTGTARGAVSLPDEPATASATSDGVGGSDAAEPDALMNFLNPPKTVRKVKRNDSDDEEEDDDDNEMQQNNEVIPLVKGQAVISHSELKKLRKGTKGWKYPQISLCIRPYRTNKNEVDPHIYHLSNVQHYDLKQFRHQSAVVYWVAPLLRVILPRFMQLLNQINTTPNRNLLRSIPSSNSEDAQRKSEGKSFEHAGDTPAAGMSESNMTKEQYMMKRMASYRDRNQSTVNILKGMNSFIVKREGPNNNTSSAGNLFSGISSPGGAFAVLSQQTQRPMQSTPGGGPEEREEGQGETHAEEDCADKNETNSTTGHPVGKGRQGGDKGISVVQEPTSVPSAARNEEENEADVPDYVVVAQKKNMNGLINYIQQNQYFPEDLKNGKSLYLTLHNLEKEQSRKKKDKIKYRLEEKRLFESLGISPFDREDIDGELYTMTMDNKLIPLNKSNLLTAIEGGSPGEDEKEQGVPVGGGDGTITVSDPHSSILLEQDSGTSQSRGEHSFRNESDLVCQQTLDASVQDTLKGIAFDANLDLPTVIAPSAAEEPNTTASGAFEEITQHGGEDIGSGFFLTTAGSSDQVPESSIVPPLLVKSDSVPTVGAKLPSVRERPGTAGLIGAGSSSRKRNKLLRTRPASSSSAAASGPHTLVAPRGGTGTAATPGAKNAAALNGGISSSKIASGAKSSSNGSRRPQSAAPKLLSTGAGRKEKKTNATSSSSRTDKNHSRVQGRRPATATGSTGTSTDISGGGIRGRSKGKGTGGTTPPPPLLYSRTTTSSGHDANDAINDETPGSVSIIPSRSPSPSSPAQSRSRSPYSGAASTVTGNLFGESPLSRPRTAPALGRGDGAGINGTTRTEAPHLMIPDVITKDMARSMSASEARRIRNIKSCGRINNIIDQLVSIEGDHHVTTAAAASADTAPQNILILDGSDNNNVESDTNATAAVHNAPPIATKAAAPSVLSVERQQQKQPPVQSAVAGGFAALVQAATKDNIATTAAAASPSTELTAAQATQAAAGGGGEGEVLTGGFGFEDDEDEEEAEEEEMQAATAGLRRASSRHFVKITSSSKKESRSGRSPTFVSIDITPVTPTAAVAADKSPVGILKRSSTLGTVDTDISANYNSIKSVSAAATTAAAAEKFGKRSTSPTLQALAEQVHQYENRVKDQNEYDRFSASSHLGRRATGTANAGVGTAGAATAFAGTGTGEVDGKAGMAMQLPEANKQRIDSIIDKFSKSIEVTQEVKYESYDPFRNSKSRYQQKMMERLKRKKANSTGGGGGGGQGAGGYVTKNDEFPDIIDCEQEDAKRAAKQSARAASAFDTGYFGPYKPKMMYMYISWTRNLNALTHEKCVALNPHIATDLQLDIGTMYENQPRYEFEKLLGNSEDQAYQQLFVGHVQNLAKNYQHKILTEVDLQSTVFDGAQVHERTNIYMFIKLARLLYAMMENSTPAKDKVDKMIERSKSGKLKPEPDIGGKSSLKSKFQAAIKRAVAISSLKSLGSGISEQTRQVKEAVGAADLNINLDLPDYIGSKYIVEPHPSRGFRHWTVPRRYFNQLLRFVDSWAALEQMALLVQHFTDIVQSLVPKNDLHKYRSLKNMTLMVNRAGLRSQMELTAEILHKILEHVLEVKPSSK